MTWSVELLLAGAALLCAVSGEPAPADRLRDALAERWGVAPGLIRFESDSARRGALAAARGELRITGVLADGRVLIADSAGQHLWIRAGFEVEVPVASRDLPRGTTIDTTDVRLGREVAWGGVPPFRRLPYGWVAQRTVRAGEPLAPPAVAVPIAVRAGDEVRAFWAKGTIRLEVAARAAGTGAVGDTVAVRTVNGRRLHAVISAPREVVLLGSGGTN